MLDRFNEIIGTENAAGFSFSHYNAQALHTQSRSQTRFGAHDVVIGGNDEVPNVHHPDQGLILRETKLVRSKVHWIRAA
jgi:hypothetical protein